MPLPARGLSAAAAMHLWNPACAQQALSHTSSLKLQLVVPMTQVPARRSSWRMAHISPAWGAYTADAAASAQIVMEYRTEIPRSAPCGTYEQRVPPGDTK